MRSLFFVLSLFLFTVVFAQDPVEQNPDIYKVLFENDEIRVIQVTYALGVKEKPHGHPRYVIKVIEGGRLMLYTDDADPVETVVDSDQVLLLDPVKRHWAENIGDTTVRIISVEYKE